MKHKIVFLSYDLGLRGDYESLFYFLDKYQAKECGNNLAVFEYAYSDESFLEPLEKELKESVKLEKSDRLYVVWKNESDSRMKGKFIHGNRKLAPWNGYAATNKVTEDTEV